MVEALFFLVPKKFIEACLTLGAGGIDLNTSDKLAFIDLSNFTLIIVMLYVFTCVSIRPINYRSRNYLVILILV